jgi:co-chaperonin GroES (HSP10)
MTEIVTGSLRMLGDRILLRPLDWKASEIIIAIRHGRPVRGEVVAVGPGKWVKRYVTGKRDGKDFRKSYETNVFLKTEVKPGDIINIGGLNIFDGQGYMALLEVVVGAETLLIFQEADVCLVEDDSESALKMRNFPQYKLDAPFLSEAVT